MEKISNRIREHRERADISQAQLAQLIGTSPQQISRLERGYRRVHSAWLQKVADALHVRQADLLVDAERTAPRGGDKQTEIEIKLLQFWRGLTVEAQDVIIDVISRWARNTILAQIREDKK